MEGSDTPAGSAGDDKQVRIVGYREAYRSDFERLNRTWIEAHFRIEKADEAVLADPHDAVVEPGGQIFFLLEGEAVRGTCAVVPHGRGKFELAKMAVDPEARGRGYGNRLIEAAIDFARQKQAGRLVLVTNSGLTPAVRLYEKYGFREVPMSPEDSWERADMRMHLDLAPTAS